MDVPVGFAVEPDGAPVAGSMRSPAAAAMSPSPNTSPHLPDSRFEVDAHAPGLVAVRYDLEQESGAFDVDRWTGSPVRR